MGLGDGELDGVGDPDEIGDGDPARRPHPGAPRRGRVDQQWRVRVAHRSADDLPVVVAAIAEATAKRHVHHAIPQ